MKPDNSDLVHQEGLGNGFQSECLAKDVRRIDRHRVGDTKLLDVGSDDFRSLNIDGNGQDLEVFGAMFFVKFLPNWQIVAAPSPACPAFNQDALAAEAGQRQGPTLQFWKTEIRGKLANARR